MADGHAARPRQAGRMSYGFGRFVLHSRERALLADGAPVGLGSRAFDILLLLIETAGELMTKGDALDRAWPGVAVEENNLQVQISTLRRVLGADRHWIVTVAGRGYCFTAPITVLSKECDPAASEAAVRRPRCAAILVLPLAYYGDESSRDCFARAMTDSLLTDLARALPTGTVFAHTPAPSGTWRDRHVRGIARAYGAHYVLMGSVLLAGECIRVNAQLIEADSGAHVWAERFDKHRIGTLQDQDEIVGRLSRSIGLHMAACSARRARHSSALEPTLNQRGLTSELCDVEDTLMTPLSMPLRLRRPTLDSGR